MKSNIIPMQNGIVKSGEFSFSRRAAKLKAYGEEFELPPRLWSFPTSWTQCARKC